MRPRIGALTVAAFLALTCAPTASAGLLQRDVFGSLVYTHAPLVEGRQAHDVVIEPSAGGYRIADAGADIVICDDPTLCGPAPCVNGATRREALCAGDVARLRVILGSLNDRLENRTSLDLLACGGPGNDVLSGGSGMDTLGGGVGRDRLYGRAGADNLAVDLAGQLALDQGHDCAPGAGAERFELLDGGAGRDQIYAGPGDDLVAGGEDGDILVGHAGADHVEGGAGADLILGLEGADRLEGGEQDDLLFGGPADDDLEGGPGNDDLGRTIRYDVDDLGPGTELATAVEEGDDRLDGGEGTDHLVAGPSDRVFDTSSPSIVQEGIVDRRLESQALNGADRFVGGPGEDIVSYTNRDLPVDVSLDGLANDGSAGEGDRVDTDVEHVFGGARADLLRADDDGARLRGDLGGDTIIGGAGPDVLLGGADDGDDSLAGAGGADELRGGPGDDALEGGAGTDALLAGGGDDRAFGGRDVDGLEGGPGADLLDGGAGADCLFGFVFPAAGKTGCPEGEVNTPSVGADSADVLRGGSGLDRLAGGAGEDMADYADMRRRVVVMLPGAPATWAPSPQTDRIAADVEGARGGRGHDLLVGNRGDNVFDGGPGDDQVEGVGGVDRLRGGSGQDLIVSRDRDPDAVRCGTKRDLAAIDAEDELVAALSDVCEVVDGGGGPAGSATRVRPGGDCLLAARPPGRARVVLLHLRASLPSRTVVDALSCPARLRGSTLRGGAFALGSDHRGIWARVRSGRVRVSAGEGRPRRLLGPGRTYLAPSRSAAGRRR